MDYSLPLYCALLLVVRIPSYDIIFSLRYINVGDSCGIFLLQVYRNGCDCVCEICKYLYHIVHQLVYQSMWQIIRGNASRFHRGIADYGVLASSARRRWDSDLQCTVG